jgi:probable rRNA maturation factor
MVFKNTKLAHDGLNLVLVPDREIVRINRKYLKRNRVTDIISFTLSEKPLSGDIYISKEQSKKQAKQAGHSWGHELLYLAIHGFLHLLDHRDYTAAQKKKMFAIQDKIFNEVVRVKG